MVVLFLVTFLVFGEVSCLVALNGTGSSLAGIIYEQYIFAYSLVQPNVTITYTSTGSGAGISAIESDSVIWAGSDAVLVNSDYEKVPTIQQYPFLAGSVIPIYHLPELEGRDVLNLGREEIGCIFGGVIRMWNDPKIVALNPNLASKLPAAPILVVVREDTSGTTEIFTNSLSSMSPTFRSIVGGTTYFPDAFTAGKNFIRQPQNEGVVAAVRVFKHSIGYCSLSYILTAPIPFAAVVNKAGTLVTNALDGVSEAGTTSFQQKHKKFTFPKKNELFGQLIMLCSIQGSTLPFMIFQEQILGQLQGFRT